jgi:hypothetical protein
MLPLLCWVRGQAGGAATHLGIGVVTELEMCLSDNCRVIDVIDVPVILTLVSILFLYFNIETKQESSLP